MWYWCSWTCTTAVYKALTLALSNYTYNERLSLLNIPSLEQRRMCADLILCYKMLFGHLNICSVDFFETRPAGITRGHPYKLCKLIRVVLLGSPFFLNGFLMRGTIFQLTLTFHHPSPLNVKLIVSTVWNYVIKLELSNWVVRFEFLYLCFYCYNSVPTGSC